MLGITQTTKSTAKLTRRQSAINTSSATIQEKTLIQPQLASVNVSVRMILSVIINCIIIAVVIYKTPYLREIRSMRNVKKQSFFIEHLSHHRNNAT